MKKRLIIKNEISEISRLNKFVEECGKELDISMGLAMSLNLAIEEAVSNVIMYASPETKKQDIYIDVEQTKDFLVFTIIDKGIEFDPTQKEDTDVTLPIEERSIGGLGIFLIKKIMDEVTYKREEGQNILTLRKKINNQIT
ncbi:serine/threonine-protein kinase RsbW [Dysgonomonadaceae bacterium PH5-43]|nr:serine/threonine-protein kinase RsbW [Dysgonomonadaceae bacterium PH5-43]